MFYFAFSGRVWGAVHQINGVHVMEGHPFEALNDLNSLNCGVLSERVLVSQSYA